MPATEVDVNVHPTTAAALVRKGLAQEVGAQRIEEVRSGQFGRGWGLKTYVAHGWLVLTEAGIAAVNQEGT